MEGKVKTLIIQTNEQEPEDGIFLVNPQWTHLDKKEIKEKIDSEEKLFKVNFEDAK